MIDVYDTTKGATMLSTRFFGTTPDGKDTQLFMLSNASGTCVGVSDLGAILVSCRVPDGRGDYPDVLLGHSGVAGYFDDGYNLGAVIGRCANRIAGARFELAGSSYRLAANSGPHSLHSGPHKWSERLWKVVDSTESSVTFELTSRKGDQGFPGSVQTRLTYQLSDDNRLTLNYEALPSEATIINLTSHAYWNLNGHASGSVESHTLQVCATSYTPMAEQIPTGEVASVEGTPYDFREPRTIASCLPELPQGLDDNWCLGNNGKLSPAARLVGDATGITMEVLTTTPGIQAYTASYFGVENGKDGMRYGTFAGIALETQHYPDAIHHKSFPQPVYTPDRPYRSTTVFVFGTSETV